MLGFIAATNERISVTDSMQLLVEAGNVDHATPATVSRAGILYINAEDIGWLPYVERWASPWRKKCPEVEKSMSIPLLETDQFIYMIPRLKKTTIFVVPSLFLFVAPIYFFPSFLLLSLPSFLPSFLPSPLPFPSRLFLLQACEPLLKRRQNSRCSSTATFRPFLP